MNKKINHYKRWLLFPLGLNVGKPASSTTETNIWTKIVSNITFIWSYHHSLVLNGDIPLTVQTVTKTLKRKSYENFK